MGCCVSTLDLWELEVLTVNPSDTPSACHLPPGGRYKRSPLQGNDTGRVREGTSSRKLPCEIVSGHWPQAPLCKGDGTAQP